jgi:Tfp pilus assembly protein PilV
MSKEKSRKGQSLIEAMIALGVLTTGFLGIISILSKSFFYERMISDTMTATYLASEGIEVVKNIIDNAALNSEWGSCFSNGNYNYEVDYTSTCDNLNTYSASDYLSFDSNTGLYSYSYDSSLPKTNFSREIKIAKNGDEITVNSIVNWNSGILTNQSITMEDHFYNWQPK